MSIVDGLKIVDWIDVLEGDGERITLDDIRDASREAARVIEELETDQRRLEWLVDQEASVCYVLGAWSVWFDKESDAGVSGQDWRDVVDHAMKDEEES